MQAKKMVLSLLVGTLILDAIFVVRDLVLGRTIFDGLWIYLIGIIPFGLLLFTVRNRRVAVTASMAGLLYWVLYCSIALYVTFFSTSGLDAIALVTLPIFAAVLLTPLMIVSCFLREVPPGSK